MSNVVLGLFEDSHLLKSIREDLVQDSNGLIEFRAGMNSTTVERTKRITTHALFPLLGPLSRMLSLSLSSVVRSLPPTGLQEILFAEKGPAMAIRMKAIAAQWQSQWLSCRLSGIEEDQIGKIGS